MYVASLHFYTKTLSAICAGELGVIRPLVGMIKPMKTTLLLFSFLLTPVFGHASHVEECMFYGEVTSDPTLSPNEVQFKFNVSRVKELNRSYSDCTFYINKAVDVYSDSQKS